jgi:hypothetical protein
MITLLLVKSTRKKIIRGMIPVKFQNLNGWSSVLPKYSSLVFLYEDNKFRKCPQRNGQGQVLVEHRIGLLV